MRRNYNEFRNIWFGWEDKISIIIMDFPILLVRKYDWLEKERSNWLVQVMGVDLLPSITRKLRPLYGGVLYEVLMVWRGSRVVRPWNVPILWQMLGKP